MQPVHAGSGKTAAAGAGTSLNTAAFWNKRSDDVAVQDVFFHEYFSKMGKAGQENRKKKAKDQEPSGSGEDEGSEAGEDEIWQALVNSRPDVEGDDDSDEESDAEFNDLMGLEDSDEEMDGAEEDDISADETGEPDGLEGLLDDEDDEDDDMAFDNEEDEGEAGSEKPAVESKKPESAHKARRRALKNLPMFASVDDYAEMLAQEEDGM